jgi:type II secretory pathway pseudopilin PulG
MKKIFPISAAAKGFTFVETMAVIVIGLFLATLVGLGANRAIQNSKLDQTAAAIRVTAGELDMFITEHSAPSVSAEVSAEDMAAAFINDFNAGYASMTFDLGTLSVTGNSFTAESLVKTDAWRNEYMLYYSAERGLFAVASAGPNAVFEFTSSSDISGVDDIFAVVIRK